MNKPHTKAWCPIKSSNDCKSHHRQILGNRKNVHAHGKKEVESSLRDLGDSKRLHEQAMHKRHGVRSRVATIVNRITDRTKKKKGKQGPQERRGEGEAAKERQSRLP